jgi:hypothetical protein
MDGLRKLCTLDLKSEELVKILAEVSCKCYNSIGYTHITFIILVKFDAHVILNFLS